MEKIADLVKNVIPQKANMEQPLIQCTLCDDTGWVYDPIADEVQICPCQKAALKQKRRKKAGIAPFLEKCRFENFSLNYYPETLVAESGESYWALAEKTLDACKKFAIDSTNGKERKGLLISGNFGCGKTFLAAAIANVLVDEKVDVLFLVVPDFLDELRATYGNNEFTEEELMTRAKNAKVLILDDLGAYNYSDWTQQKIFSLINYRLNHNLPCIITTNLNSNEMGAVINMRNLSRIIEMCDSYKLMIDKDIRLKKA